MLKQHEIELYQMIRAGYPVIAVVSSETSRVIASLQDIIENDYALKCERKATPTRRRLFEWSVTRGLFEISTRNGNLGTRMTVSKNDTPYEILPNPVSEAVGIFDYIVKYDPPKLNEKFELVSGDRPAIYVIKDAQDWFEHPDVVRGLRDAAEMLISRNQMLVLVSSEFTAPSSAAKDIAVLDWPLPDAAELLTQIESFVVSIESQGIDNVLNNDLDILVNNLAGLTMNEADQVLARAVTARGQLDIGALEYIKEAKKEAIRSSGALEYYDPVSIDEVGGLDILKRWLDERKDAGSPASRAFGLLPPKGVLLVGVPGCGKSLSAKMASAIKNVPLLRLDVGALFGGLVGQSESQTRQALKVVEAVGPCVLWIDEIEKALTSGGNHDGGTSRRLFATLLTWMEESNGEALVFATANDITSLKPELVRRFSERFFVDLPASNERVTILEIHIAQSGRADCTDYDLESIATATEGFAGSELAELVQSALWRAYRQERELIADDLLTCAASTTPLSKTKAADIARMREWATRARYASSEQEQRAAQPVTAVSTGRGRRLDV